MPKIKKSYTKRLKQTKKGKTMARPKGQNHFRSRKSGERKAQLRSLEQIELPKKIKERFLSKQ